MPWILRTILSFFPLLLLAYAYSGWRLYRTLDQLFGWPKTILNWSFLAAVTYLNLYPVVLFLLHTLGLENLARSAREGNRFWDIFFSYPFWIGLILMVELLPWLLAIDFVKLPFFPFYKRFRETWLVWQDRIILLVFASVVSYVVIKVVLDNARILVTKRTVTVKNLPSSMNGLRIAHISDVQIDSRTRPKRVRRYVKKVNSLQPDLIFFTGDLVTTGTKYIQKGAHELGKLKAKYGVYACLGDHDYWAGPSQVTQSLNSYAIKTHENANLYITLERDSILVTFLTNIYSQRPNLTKLHALFGQQPRGALDIVITHQPSEELVELAAESGYHIFLAGHTHGGQIVFRPFGYVFTPPKFESAFYRGTRFVERMFLSINNGLGLTLAPLRFNAPAEVTLIRIMASPE